MKKGSIQVKKVSALKTHCVQSEVWKAYYFYLWTFI